MKFAYTQRSQLLSTLFSSTVSVAELWGKGDESTLYPEERAQIRYAVEKRRREFAGGRECAHFAINQLRGASTPLGMQPDRTVNWPQGIIGAITHTEGYCAAAVSYTSLWMGLGLDAENIAHVDWNLRLEILTSDEVRRLERMEASYRQLIYAATFIAKEAFFKCQFPATQKWIGFTDVEVLFRSHTFQVIPHVCLGGLNAHQPFNGAFATRRGLVFAGVGIARKVESGMLSST